MGGPPSWRLLLSNQADSARRCVDHKQSRRAIDFAKPTERNARERWARSGRQHCLYKEDTRTRNLDRVEIVRILSECIVPASCLKLLP